LSQINVAWCTKCHLFLQTEVSHDSASPKKGRWLASKLAEIRSVDPEEPLH
jgi:hypothetical protein